MVSTVHTAISFRSYYRLKQRQMTVVVGDVEPLKNERIAPSWSFNFLIWKGWKIGKKLSTWQRGERNEIEKSSSCRQLIARSPSCKSLKQQQIRTPRCCRQNTLSNPTSAFIRGSYGFLCFLSCCCLAIVFAFSP